MTTPDQTALLLENARLREALERVWKLRKMTILCNETDWDSITEAYSAGATNAFCEAADIANGALFAPPSFARGAELIRKLRDAAKRIVFFSQDCSDPEAKDFFGSKVDRDLLRDALKELEKWEAGK